MNIEFTSHNIRLDDGTLTKPEMGRVMTEQPRFLAAKRILDTVFPGDKAPFRLADLGCLEGGYAVEFARMGFQVLGLDVRAANIAACQYVKAHTHLPQLNFAQDDARNIARYGSFDVVFCCGLLYHLDHPKQFLETLSTVTKKLVILQTHFAEADQRARDRLPRLVRLMLSKLWRDEQTSADKYGLSPICEHESLRGRWFTEFRNDSEFDRREDSRWASWNNRRSFWIQREYLLQAIHAVGFDLVMEQYDDLGPHIAESMRHGYYKADSRGTFIGIKTRGA
jgi:SAM-dependent methyltransferase